MPVSYTHLDVYKRQIITLDEFPLTYNGKLDNNKLKSICSEHLSSQNDETANSDMLEMLLNAAEETIGQKIYPKDNFYAVGGDSIKAIQISSKLSDRGINLTVRDILTNPVFDKMALYSVNKETDNKIKSVSAGYITNTPIIKWFLTSVKYKRKYNQALLFKVSNNLSINRLEEAFGDLTKFHGILNVNLDATRNMLFYNNRNSKIECEFIDAENAEISSKNIFNDFEFDLENEYLLKPFIIKQRDGVYLMLIANHLIIDGVSWRILADCLIDIMSGKNLEKLNPEVSYKYYAEKYNNYLNNINPNISYWKRLEDISSKQSFDLSEDVKTYILTLDESLSFLLANKANLSYNTNPQDLIISALYMTLTAMLDVDYVIFESENHGRDLPFNIDINNTLGWFTGFYPALIKAPSDADVGYCIMEVKDTLRNSAKYMHEYGYLKFVKESLNIKNLVKVNYLGQFTAQNRGLILQQVYFSSEISEDNILEFDILNSEKNIQIIIKKNIDINVELLMKNLTEKIRTITDLCINNKETVYTPSDFGTSEINQQELDEILNQ